FKRTIRTQIENYAKMVSILSNLR
uniref:Transposase n=1 Tax=Bursaphelenchus xylophilus TaxID=6326 RepID=A0A1I7SI96_BURXY